MRRRLPPQRVMGTKGRGSPLLSFFKIVIGSQSGSHDLVFTIKKRTLLLFANICITVDLYNMDDPYAICNEATDDFEEAQPGAGFKLNSIPHTTKRKSKLPSLTSLQCFYWKEHQLHQTRSESEGNCITHAGNKGEQRIQTEQSPIYFNGFDKETQTVYEFQGCFYHG